MAHNRGRTRPERALASALWKRGLRYLTDEGYRARYGHHLPGHPDLVFVGHRVVVFVDGCFWHGCSECGSPPSQSGDFWRRKIEANVERDQQVTTRLESEGWTVVRVPEHSVRTKRRLQETADRLSGTMRHLRNHVQKDPD